MDICPERFDGKLYVTDPAQAKILHGDAAMIHAAEFPDAGIRREFILMIANKVMQVNAGSFLFAFDDELDVTGQFSVCVEDGIDGM